MHGHDRNAPKPTVEILVPSLESHGDLELSKPSIRHSTKVKSPVSRASSDAFRSPGFSESRDRWDGGIPNTSTTVESLGLEGKHTESRQAKSPQLFNIIAVTVLFLMVCISFVLLFTSFTSDQRDTTFATGRKSLRDFVLYFPCEATGNSHPNCKGKTSNLTSSFRRSPTAFKSWRPSRNFDRRKALDYVSKRDPPENFEHWLDFAKDNRCITGSYSRIEKDLEAFADSETGVIRIQRHHIEGARAMAKTILFKVQNGSLTIEGPDEGGFQDNFKGLMSRFLKYLPDMEFVANLMDEPRVLPGNTTDVDVRMGSTLCEHANESFLKYRHLHGFINNRQIGPKYDPNPELVALFSQTKINECHRDIMFPTLYTLDSQLPAEDEENLKPWSERKEVLFFRGTTTGGEFEDASKQRLSHRQRLVKFAKDKENIDIGFTGMIQCEPSVCEAMEEEYGVANKVPYMENFDHKYLMSIDGNSFVSRLPRFMQSASLMFRAGIFDEWYEEWIAEGKHYLRVALDYSDLDSKISWAIDNDDEAKEIGLQARDFSKKHLRREDMECYLFRLLLEYAHVLDI